MISFVCIHGTDEPVRLLRWRDTLSVLLEIRARAVRDWGWTLPASFNLCLTEDGINMCFVCSARLTSDGIVL